MNQTRYGLLTVMLCMALLVLQGCGGNGDGSGISQDMYDTLQAELDAAEDGQMTAEAAAAAAIAAQMTAEVAKDAAMAAQTTAEAQAATAMAAQTTAEQARQAAVTAQQIAEAAEMDAEAAATAAKTALEAAETQRDMYQQGQMDAEAERDMYKTAKMEADTKLAEAEEARMTAADARIAAETALAIAKQAEMVAVQARMEAETARDDYKAKLATAEKELEALKMAMMETDMDAEMVADAAQRARVDAAAIGASAGFSILVPGVDLDGDGIFEETGNSPVDGEKLPSTRSSTKTVRHYQGSETRPFVDKNGDGLDGGTIDADIGTTGIQLDLSDAETLRITATRTGSTVNIVAAAGSGNDKKTFFDVSDEAGSGERTSIMAEADVPGGHTKHIFLMTDIEAPASSVFGENVPNGLATMTTEGTPAPIPGAGFHDATQMTRYGLVDVDNESMPLGLIPLPNAELTDEDMRINVDLSGAVDITLGALAPTDAVPVQTTVAQASFAGSYAGVAGTYVCNGICTFTRNADSELLVSVAGTEAEGAGPASLLFVPAGPTRRVADADYLIYGAWLKRPDSAVGMAISAALGTGSNLFDALGVEEETAQDPANGLRELTGKAKYKGSAAGYFAERHVDADAAVSGTFTAAAELSANFDGGTRSAQEDATTGGGVLSGTITDFVRSDDVVVDWMVNLNLVDLGATTTAAAAVTAGTVGAPGTQDATIVNGATNLNMIDPRTPGGFAEGSTTGSASGASWSGEWGVQFVGAGATAAANQQHPTGVVGTFGAEHGFPARLTDEPGTGETVADEGFVGVIGGFGARKE